MRRGSVFSRMGVVSRDTNPAVFWFVAAANALIALGAFLIAFGVLRK